MMPCQLRIFCIYELCVTMIMMKCGTDLAGARPELLKKTQKISRTKHLINNTLFSNTPHPVSRPAEKG